MRVAVYYAPAPTDPLWIAAAAWLGRDAETAALVPQPPVEGLAAITADPRRYGFHATLKPPMRLSTSYGAFMDAAESLARGLAPFELPRLAVTDLKGFLALCETAPSPALQHLADRCVEGLDAHRAPPGVEEATRRRSHGLSVEQEEMLARWGYPHVFGLWQFHMTLTQRLDQAERDRIAPLAAAHFADALARPRRVDSLAIFTQAGPDAPFLVAERVALRG